MCSLLYADNDGGRNCLRKGQNVFSVECVLSAYRIRQAQSVVLHVAAQSVAWHVAALSVVSHVAVLSPYSA